LEGGLLEPLLLATAVPFAALARPLELNPLTAFPFGVTFGEGKGIEDRGGVI
jgi:hypothetical protein